MNCVGDTGGSPITHEVGEHASAPGLGNEDMADSSSKDRYFFVGEDPPSLSPPSVPSARPRPISSYTHMCGDQRSPTSKSQESHLSVYSCFDQRKLLSQSSDSSSKFEAAQVQSMVCRSALIPGSHIEDERQDRPSEADARGSYSTPGLCGSSNEEYDREGEVTVSTSSSSNTGSKSSSSNNESNKRSDISGKEKTKFLENALSPSSAGSLVHYTELTSYSGTETTVDVEILQQRLLVSEIDASFVPHMEQMLAEYKDMMTFLAEENKRLEKSIKNQENEANNRTAKKGELNVQVGTESSREELLSALESLRNEKVKAEHESQIVIETLQKDLESTHNRYVDAKSMLHENAKLLVAARDYITTQKKRGSQPASPASATAAKECEKDDKISDLMGKISDMKKEENLKNAEVLNCLHEVMVFLFQKTAGVGERDPVKLVSSVRKTSQMITAQMAKQD
mmetsp:Transcript_37139/g.111252  ORF Transcript_37139/g.111252 Transcript_37139/m.111252 type:complete len:455 (-) Transcript_37139:84-1448(-)